MRKKELMSPRKAESITLPALPRQEGHSNSKKRVSQVAISKREAEFLSKFGGPGKVNTEHIAQYIDEMSTGGAFDGGIPPQREREWVTFKDMQNKLVVQPKFMTKTGSMSVLELWTERNKKKLVDLHRPEVQETWKMPMVDADRQFATVVRPDLMKTRKELKRRLDDLRAGLTLKSDPDLLLGEEQIGRHTEQIIFRTPRVRTKMTSPKEVNQKGHFLSVAVSPLQAKLHREDNMRIATQVDELLGECIDILRDDVEVSKQIKDFGRTFNDGHFKRLKRRMIRHEKEVDL
eukprot:TRINITY_DN1192_c0_g1_i3.p1 TRINITY_DN1192_c0_g1~~TRINITY_DN1192_c0_g1_i3.p1  ORF type:complete len:290 (-),score=55.19 TRINITY_DN1192_c0_g1_i3:100-969(-)